MNIEKLKEIRAAIDEMIEAISKDETDKPKPERRFETFTPKNGVIYRWISGDGGLTGTSWNNEAVDHYAHTIGNVFDPNTDDAENVLALLKNPAWIERRNAEASIRAWMRDHGIEEADGKEHHVPVWGIDDGVRANAINRVVDVR